MRLRLSAEERKFLQWIYDSYRETGEWPTLEEASRALVQDLNAEAVARDLHPRLGERILPSSTSERLSIPMRALAKLENGLDFYALMPKLLAVLREIYFDSTVAARISSADLRNREWSESEIAEAFHLLKSEYILTGGGSWQNPTEWRFEIRPYVRDLAGVKTAADYVRLRLKQEKQRNAPPLWDVTGRVRSWYLQRRSLSGGIMLSATETPRSRISRIAENVIGGLVLAALLTSIPLFFQGPAEGDLEVRVLDEFGKPVKGAVCGLFTGDWSLTEQRADSDDRCLWQSKATGLYLVGVEVVLDSTEETNIPGLAALWWGEREFRLKRDTGPYDFARMAPDFYGFSHEANAKHLTAIVAFKHGYPRMVRGTVQCVWDVDGREPWDADVEVPYTLAQGAALEVKCDVDRHEIPAGTRVNIGYIIRMEHPLGNLATDAGWITTSAVVQTADPTT